LLLRQNSDEIGDGVGLLLSGSITPEENGKSDYGRKEETGNDVAEKTELETEENDTNSLQEMTAEPTELGIAKQSDEPTTFCLAMKDMFTKFEVNVLIYLLFFMYITHTCLQGITPFVAERMLKWNETKVSIVYTVWGLEIIAVLIVVWLVSPKIADRVILLSAVICGSLASVSLIVLTYSTPESKLCYYSFLVTIFLDGVGISITVVVGRSLVSKHTRPENQGLVHAILTSFNLLAGLLVPLGQQFGSRMYTVMEMVYLNVGVQFFGLILVIAVFGRLKVVNIKS
jgi:MFS family permease